MKISSFPYGHPEIISAIFYVIFNTKIIILYLYRISGLQHTHLFLTSQIFSGYRAVVISPKHFNSQQEDNAIMSVFAEKFQCKSDGEHFWILFEKGETRKPICVLTDMEMDEIVQKYVQVTYNYEENTKSVSYYPVNHSE